MPPDESITYVTQNIKINLFKSFTIVHDTHRLALMNAMLHDIEGAITLGDTLSNLGKGMCGYDVEIGRAHV